MTNQPTTTISQTMFEDLEADIEFNAPIGKTMTWYHIGGNADILIKPHSVDALTTITKRCRESAIPLRVLGSGANLLIHDDGIDGVVIHLNHPTFRASSALHRHRRNRGGDGEPGDGLRIMAGAAMERLVMHQAKQGMAGLEIMAGIPASVGGAIRMNAGGKFGAIADAVKAVGTISLEGNPITYQRTEIEFDYRRCSIIDPIILWVEFALNPEDPAIVHQRVKDIFAFKKKSQPLAAKSAGCVFKNPRVRRETTQATKSNERVSAGMLIDQAGLKNYTVGQARVSDRHANFITAEKNASAQDIITIMDHLQHVVHDQTGYHLERELVIWCRSTSR